MFNTVSLSSGALLRELSVLEHLQSVDSDLEYHVLHSPGSAVGEVLTGETMTGHEVRFIRNSMRSPARTARRLIWDNVALPAWVRSLEGDVLFFPLQITNLVDVAPKVVGVRNIAPFYETVQPGRSWYESTRLSLLRRATRRSVRQAERVLFYTESTRERVSEFVPSAREKAVVIPHAVPDGFEPIEPDQAVLERYDLPEEYLLSVSNIARYKNQRELISGYSRAAKRADCPPLVLAGKTVDADYAEELDSHIDTCGVRSSVQRIGFVEHEDLPHLHAGSSGFVFPSACENAPISLIEAMGCEVPIASSDATSMPEICGDAAVYFDPDEPMEIADAIVSLVTDAELRASLRSAASERTADLSWGRVAERTDQILSDVIASEAPT